MKNRFVTIEFGQNKCRQQAKEIEVEYVSLNNIQMLKHTVKTMPFRLIVLLVEVKNLLREINQ